MSFPNIACNFRKDSGPWIEIIIPPGMKDTPREIAQKVRRLVQALRMTEQAKGECIDLQRIPIGVSFEEKMLSPIAVEVCQWITWELNRGIYVLTMNKMSQTQSIGSTDTDD